MQPVIEAKDITVRRGQTLAIAELNWTVGEGEHWVVLGPNGAGKTSLMLLVSTQLHPTSGSLKLLGESIGLTDVFELRPRIGLTSAGIADQFRAEEKVLDIVRTAAHGMTGIWRERYDPVDDARANFLLTEWGVQALARRQFASLSEGERKRVLIARALMTDPELLLLDEPTAGMDIAAREELLQLLTVNGNRSDAPVSVLVTHHVEEIPANTTHALLLRGGVTVAAGPINVAMTDRSLSDTFGLELELVNRSTSRGQRWAVLPK